MATVRAATQAHVMRAGVTLRVRLVVSSPGAPPKEAAGARGSRNAMLSVTLVVSVFQSLVLVVLALLWCSAEAMPGPSALPQPAAGAVANPEAAADPEAWRGYYGRGRYGYYRPSHSTHYYHDHHHHIVCAPDHCHDIVHYHH